MSRFSIVDQIFSFLFVDKCCKFLLMNSSGLAGTKHPELMGTYEYYNTDSNGYNEYKGPNSNYLFHNIDAIYWFVS